MTYSTWELEKQLWSKGYSYIAGIDEAGRGPWAGPVVAGAVCFERNYNKDLALRDSKVMSEKAREKAFITIKEVSLAFGIGVIDNVMIDKVGIAEAVLMAMSKALVNLEQMLKQKVDYLIIDGSNVKDIKEYEQNKINKADALHCSVSAAAVLAKVQRDMLMKEYAVEFPQFGFERNKAYGTKEHKEALQKYGPTRIHRFSYKPVSKVAEKFDIRQIRRGSY